MIERERDIVTKVKDKLCWQAPDGSLTYIDHPDDLREAGLVSVTDYLAAKNDVVQANLNMRHLIDRLDDIASKIPGAVRVAGIDSAVSFVYDVLNGRLNGRPRRVAQILIDEIGAAGPESSETTAVRMVEALRSARAEVERLKAAHALSHPAADMAAAAPSPLPDGVPVAGELAQRERAIADVIAAARTVQDFLWGPTDGSWGLTGWIGMFQKRARKLNEIDRDNPHAAVALRKRLLQIGAIAVKFMAYVEEHGVPWDATVPAEELRKSPAADMDESVASLVTAKVADEREAIARLVEVYAGSSTGCAAAIRDRGKP